MTRELSILVLLAGRAMTQPVCGPSTSAVIELGSHTFVQDSFPKHPGDTVYAASVPPGKVRWVRAQVRLDRVGTGNWHLDVRDARLRPVDSMSAPDFFLTPVRWTPRIYSEGLYLDLRSQPAPSQPSFTVLQYIVMPQTVQPTYYSYKKKDAPDWRYTDDLVVDPDNLRRVRMADTVGLFFSNVPGVGTWTCSGVLVAPGLFLTNYHCGGPSGTPDQDLWSPEIRQDSFIDLSWDGDHVSRELRVVKLERGSRQLDYALLQVEPLDRQPLPDPAPIRMEPPRRNEPIELVHHPAAARKAISSCVVTDASYPGWQNPAVDSEIAYDCDTDEGSSGAPLFIAGKLVALHHLGYSRGPGCTSDGVNKAVKISEIISSLTEPLATRLRAGK